MKEMENLLNGEIDLKSVTGIAKTALMRIAQLKAPLTPESYRLWFAYYQGENKDLVQAIDEHVKAGDSFSNHLVHDLYDEIFGNEANMGSLRKLQAEVKVLFSKILGRILKTSDFTTEYRAKIEVYSDELGRADSLEDVRNIVDHIVEDTDQMAENSRGLEVQLRDVSSHAAELEQELEEVINRSNELEVKLEEAREEAGIDALTNLPNRRSFDTRLQKAFDLFQETGEVFGIVAIDIDHFKQFNDAFGHAVGDEVLRIVGSLLRHSVKKTDFAARCGGEEFTIILPKTPLEGSVFVGEKVRALFSNKKFKLVRTGKYVGTITVSAGISAIRSGDTMESVVDRADQALYLAKHSGRNNVKSETFLEAAEKE